MAIKLLFCDSFDHYSLSQMSGKWTSGAGGAFTFLVVGRTSNAYQTTFATQVTIPGGVRTNMTIGAFRTCTALTGDDQLAIGPASGQNGNFFVNADGTIGVKNAANAIVGLSTKVAFEAGVGHYVELGVNCHPTNGQIIVRVDGEELINVTNTNTGTGAQEVTVMGIGGGNTAQYDDLYVSYDDAGGISFFDDVVIQAISPNGAGNYSEWTGVSSTNYENVDEKPASFSDYNETDVVNEIDTFTFPDLTFTGTVKGVQIVVYAKKSDVEIRAIQGVCRISGTDYLSANTEYLSTAASFYRFVWADNPATSAAWTKAEVNSAEFGYKLVV